MLLLHGPNFNMLGRREPVLYGSDTLAEIVSRIQKHAAERGVELRAVQSNHEGAVIDAIHDAADWADGIVLNAGAYTHTSYAIRDAIVSANVPTIEVHLTNVHARESFRHRSVLAPVCRGQISGLGSTGYRLAIDALAE